MLYLDNSDSPVLHRSNDDGATWDKVDVNSKDRIVKIISHPFHNERAYLLTSGPTQFATNDRGKNWYPIEFPYRPTRNGKPFVFHASNPDYVLYAGLECSDKEFLQLKCLPQYFYTTNNFKSNDRLTHAHQCIFTQGSKEFTAGEENAILCSVNSPSDSSDNSIPNRRLAKSTNWFKDRGYQKLDDAVISSVTGLGVNSKFIVAATRRTASTITLLISTDGQTWDEAIFPDEASDFSEFEITVLESSTTSLHIDVLKSGSEQVGDLYVSNSNGSYFTKSLEHTNRNSVGFVDIEKVQNIEGILIANVVSNWEEAKNGSKKRIRTKISYDDGRSWKFLSIADSGCSGNDECGLNLHSVLDKANVGRIFSSPAPGILAAIGNPGTRLKDYEDGDLYISNDSGLTWKRSRESAHKYEFGDSGNVFVAVYDEGVTSSIFYSLDRGNSWDTLDLGIKVRTKYLFTTQDSTTMKFTLIGKSPDNKDQTLMIAIDFTGIYSKQCVLKEDGSADFEKWYARWSDRTNPSCMLGRKQYFYRKKAKAECYVGNEYKEQLPTSEPCLCTVEDYECDFNFVRNAEGKCIATSSFKENTGSCSSGGNSYDGLSGYRLIPGNSCTREGGVVLDTPAKKNCDGTLADGGSSNDGSNDNPSTPAHLSKSFTEFNGKIIDYFYLKSDDPSQVDETIILRTDKLEVWVSHDHGAKWEQTVQNMEIISIYANPYFPNHVYLISTKEEVAYSLDRAQSWKTFRTPALRNTRRIPYLSFNRNHADWLIWIGQTGCENAFSSTCRTTSFYTTSTGDRWNELQENVEKCTYVNSLAADSNDKLIYCEKLYSSEQGTPKTKLIWSTDYFNTVETAFPDILGFALEQEFAIVATVNPDDSLKAYASIDGKNFAEVKFPSNFKIDKQQAYTILESITHSVFMHVTTNPLPETAFGSILKSNSNGTNYVDSVDYVNRNADGYVDFEKMSGLEGVAIINVVTNPENAVKGSSKILKSQITHNDGGEWTYLVPPTKDSEGKKYNCPGSSLNRCSLNLHGYTERADYRDTFSSQSAVGMMLAVGNVGESLSPLFDGNTFFTRDGGASWKEIKKGYYMWEYGDQGSIIVIVNGHDSTNTVSYSLDEGDNWNDYQFSDELVRVEDIATVPSDTSLKFLLIGRLPLSRGERSFTIQLDFTDMFSRKCELKYDDPENDDFELWSPSHPFQENNCLFGHEAQYFRKIKGDDCYIGRSLLQPHTIVRNCSCTRQDFECDFNYARGNDGACHLVEGYTPPDHSLICKEMPGEIEYWAPTGYRRVPLSTCQGGQEFDKVESKPCPGKEGEYKQKHRGLHGFGLFFVIVLPIGMTAVVMYILWDHYSKRYGQIRLGEENDSQPVVLQYLIIIVAGAVAVVTVIPTLFASAFRSIQNRIKNRGWAGRFTSRGSFARGNSSYSVVAAEDESELLAEGLDDDSDVESDTGRV